MVQTRTIRKSMPIGKKMSSFQSRLRPFYEEHNPENIENGNFDKILEAYVDNEDTLFDRLEEKYGVRPPPCEWLEEKFQESELARAEKLRIKAEEDEKKRQEQERRDKLANEALERARAAELEAKKAKLADGGDLDDAEAGFGSSLDVGDEDEDNAIVAFLGGKDFEEATAVLDNRSNMIKQSLRNFAMSKPRSLVDDYAEIVIQYGYVTMFACAFPLAPVLALVNNFTEIRAEVYMYTSTVRRGKAEGAANIGTWLPILQIMSVIAIATNCMVMYFSSRQVANVGWSYNFVPEFFGEVVSLVPYLNDAVDADWWKHLTVDLKNDRNRLWFVLILEHVLITAHVIISVVIADQPGWVRQQMEQHDYIVEKSRLSRKDKVHAIEAAAPKGPPSSTAHDDGGASWEATGPSDGKDGSLGSRVESVDAVFKES